MGLSLGFRGKKPGCRNKDSSQSLGSLLEETQSNMPVLVKMNLSQNCVNTIKEISTTTRINNPATTIEYAVDMFEYILQEVANNSKVIIIDRDGNQKEFKISLHKLTHAGK